MQGTPKRGRRLGGDAAHQKAMLGNLVASLFAAESLVTTETRAKAMRPVAEKCITAARRGGLHQQRQVNLAERVQSPQGGTAHERRVHFKVRILGREARPPSGGQRAHGARRARLSIAAPLA